MGFFSKFFKGPEIDMENNQVVENGDEYRLIFGFTEDVGRFN